jgi:hypothetical protein
MECIVNPIHVAARWSVLLTPYIIVMRIEMYKNYIKMKIKKLPSEGWELYIVTDGVMPKHVGVY